MKWKCKNCGENRLSKLKSKTICNNCHYRRYGTHSEYMLEYMRCKRWLDGGPDNFLLGEEMNSQIRCVYEGELIIKKPSDGYSYQKSRKLRKERMLNLNLKEKNIGL